MFVDKVIMGALTFRYEALLFVQFEEHYLIILTANECYLKFSKKFSK